MQRFIAVVSGDSMWPSYADGERLVCSEDVSTVGADSVIVFQHPLYTYSCPALLKEWLDRVLSRGFASGPGGNQLAGKYWRSVITTGEPESAYRYDALNRYPMSDVLRPFELAAGMCRMHWLSPIIIYWARRQSAQELASHARAYGDWLANPLSPGGR